MADIVLPVATRFDMLDIGNDLGSGVLNSFFLEEDCIDPVGESLSDFDAVAKVAEKLGLYEEYTLGKTMPERQKLCYDVSGMDQFISWEELKEKQYFVIPCTEEIKEQPPGLSPFAKDPADSPLTTPTGLLEYSSSAIEKYFPDDPERPRCRIGSKRARVTTSVAQVTGRRLSAPLYVQPSSLRMHAQGDDITWNREARP
jgi:trimethylamine-N-oxide reductase (cytochrome c)